MKQQRVLGQPFEQQTTDGDSTGFALPTG